MRILGMEGIENKEKSLIIFFINCIYFLSLLSLFNALRVIINRTFKKYWDLYHMPYLFVDLYVLCVALVITLIFLLYNKIGVAKWLLIALPLSRLFGILGSSFSNFFIHRERKKDQFGYFIESRRSGRYIMINLINVYVILVCFAILYLVLGAQFSPQITDRITAFYQSSIILSTLGYGKIYPVSAWSKGLVMFQVGYFLLFFILILPRIISVVRVKEKM